MALPMVTLPSTTLRDRSEEVDISIVTGEETQNFIAAMIPHMYEEEGIGLAAPQVGKNIRACIIGKEAVDMDERPATPSDPNQPEILKTKKDLILINPVYERLSKKTTIDTEGCLSVPGFYGKVKRYKDIYVRALNEDGRPIEFEAHNFFARVIQHEVDHLNGTLFIDRAKGLYQTEHKKRFLEPDIVLTAIRKPA